MQGSAPKVRSLAHCRVSVVMGGTSGEREVSLLSGRSIVQALERCVQTQRLKSVQAIEIDAAGRWLVGGVARDALGALGQSADVDVFFLALHGGAGEDGTVQGLMLSGNRRHTGSSVGASALCMDKAATRALAQSAGLRVAPGRLIGPQAFAADAQGELKRALALAAGQDGWVVKPRRGGSSVNTHMLLDGGALEAAVLSVLKTGDDALVEARIRGVEVSCGVLDAFAGSDRAIEQPRALPPIEIQPAEDRFFDYEQKYADGGAREVCPPPSLSAEQRSRVEAAAVRLHGLCGCSGYSRSDFIVPPSGEPVLLEINTLPGMTPRSLLPQEAAAIGIGYDDLCLLLIESALGSTGP